MTGFIIKLQSVKNLDDLTEKFENKDRTELEKILNCNDYDCFEWIVDKDATTNDIVFFMCDKSSVDKLNKLSKMIEKIDNKDLIEYYNYLLKLYEECTEKIVAIGKIKEEPAQISESKLHDANFEYNILVGKEKASLLAKFKDMIIFDDCIDVSEFGTYVKVNGFKKIIKLNNDQLNHLMHIAKEDSSYVNSVY